MRYAAHTEVAAERSRLEIERTLTRYGAGHFAYRTDGVSAEIAFQVKGVTVKLHVDYPSLSSLSRSAKGRQRTGAATEAARDNEIRRRWRALLLIIKAKLEAVESGISTFEREFLADLVLKDGKTVAQVWLTQLEEKKLLLPAKGDT